MSPKVASGSFQPGTLRYCTIETPFRKFREVLNKVGQSPTRSIRVVWGIRHNVPVLRHTNPWPHQDTPDTVRQKSCSASHGGGMRAGIAQRYPRWRSQVISTWCCAWRRTPLLPPFWEILSAWNKTAQWRFTMFSIAVTTLKHEEIVQHASLVLSEGCLHHMKIVNTYARKKCEYWHNLYPPWCWCQWLIIPWHISQWITVKIRVDPLAHNVHFKIRDCLHC